MTARQRLPALGLRMLSALSSTPGAAHLAAVPRPPSALLGNVFAAARQGPVNGVNNVPLWSLRSFAAAGDLPAHTELGMPSLSPTMSHGNIIEWKKKEGDAVAAGDVYCLVETDKATIEWESQEDGFLAKILAPDGTKDIEVGTTVAIVVEEEGDVAAFKDYSPSSGGAAPAAAAPKPAEQPSAAPAPPSGASFPPHEVISMPALSPTMSQGNIIAWKKAEGDEVAPGDILAEMETDKATIEWESQDEGVVAKLLVPSGTNGVDVGAPVMVMVDDKSKVAAFQAFTAADAGGAPAAAPAPAAEAPPAPMQTAAKPAAAPAAPRPPAAAGGAPGGRVIASPYAKKLAADAGVSLAGVPGSGPGGRIVAADVHELIASGGGAPATAAAAPGAPAAAFGGYTDAEATQIRKVIARRLLESKQQIPHYYLTVSCRIDRLAATRQQLNSMLAASPAGGKLSVNDFVIKAAALAMRRVPEVNASWHGDFIRQYHSVDCSVAVQTPTGLMVPVVRDADRKGLSAIAAEVRDLAGRAKEGKLRPEEFSGGTFTVSNLGMFGVTQFAAIVNPPQAVILAVGAAEKRVVPAGDKFEEGTFMNVTLSCDHRVVDGAVGAQWLQAFRGFIEDPASMLL